MFKSKLTTCTSLAFLTVATACVKEKTQVYKPNIILLYMRMMQLRIASMSCVPYWDTIRKAANLLSNKPLTTRFRLFTVNGNIFLRTMGRLWCRGVLNLKSGIIKIFNYMI